MSGSVAVVRPLGCQLILVGLFDPCREDQAAVAEFSRADGGDRGAALACHIVQAKDQPCHRGCSPRHAGR
ncbi:hypothetical protein SDC9_163998 [bioreactor metagenome]|uniref:Uncharacterized protein n=1 Tax=bioreactor metagenome TaxID=1076179 RepID=A0A645FXM0_9ZZZZ